MNLFFKDVCILLDWQRVLVRQQEMNHHGDLAGYTGARTELFDETQ